MGEQVRPERRRSLSNSTEAPVEYAAEGVAFKGTHQQR